MRIVRWAALAAAFLLIALQFVPVSRTNPPVSREIKWNSSETRLLTQRACFDCHSNVTSWPWYSHVAPMSLLVVNHVTDGRQRLNFSEWDHPNANFNSINKQITSGDMPIWNYVLLHPTARLTASEKQQLLDGLNETFKQDPPVPRPDRSR